MMTRRNPVGKQLEMELLVLDEFVEQGHLLRKIQETIDFDFIYDLVAPLYAENQGRPSIDPVVLFKMSLLQFLYGIRSEERLVDEVRYNLAYRWFLGYGLRDSIPDHSTISYNRTVRFSNQDIYQEIFNHLLFFAQSEGLITGEVFYTDSTHIRSNASNSKFSNEEEEVLITEDESLLALVNDNRILHGQKPLAPAEDKKVIKRRKVSTTDPSSGYMHRDRKPQGFYHLVHETVDGEANLIVGINVTPGNVADNTVYLDHIQSIYETLEVLPSYACADAGYFNLGILEGLSEQGITPVIGPKKYTTKKGKKSKYWFSYDQEEDLYRCFEGQPMHYHTTTRQGYVEYHSDPTCCEKCPSRDQCLYEKDGSIADHQTRIIRRHIKEHYAEEARAIIKSEKGKTIYARRKETIERSHADQKELMGLRYAHYRGDVGVRSQVLMTGTAYNIKKVATILYRRKKG